MGHRKGEEKQANKSEIEGRGKAKVEVFSISHAVHGLIQVSS